MDPLGLFFSEKFFSDLGELLTMIYLDEVVVTNSGNYVIKNLLPTGNLGYYGDNSGGDGNGHAGGWGGSSDGGGGGHGGSAQIGVGVLLPQPTFRNDPNWSSVLNISLSSVSYIGDELKDSKSTYAWVKRDVPQLKISKKGYSKIYGVPSHSVAKLGKFLYYGGNFLSGLEFVGDLNSSINAFQNNNNREGIHKAVDAFMDGVSLIPGLGPIPLIITISWNIGKDQFWEYVDEHYGEVLY